MPAVLNSWKEICVFLNCGIRTAQRWEQNCGLPIRRVRANNRGPVFAFTRDIETWLKSRPSKVSIQPGSHSLNRIVRTPLDIKALAHNRELRAAMHELAKVQMQKVSTLVHLLETSATATQTNPPLDGKRSIASEGIAHY